MQGQDSYRERKMVPTHACWCYRPCRPYDNRLHLWGGASGHTYALTCQADGITDIDVVVIREGKKRGHAGCLSKEAYGIHLDLSHECPYFHIAVLQFKSFEEPVEPESPHARRLDEERSVRILTKKE